MTLSVKQKVAITSCVTLVILLKNSKSVCIEGERITVNFFVFRKYMVVISKIISNFVA